MPAKKTATQKPAAAQPADAADTTTPAAAAAAQGAKPTTPAKPAAAAPASAAADTDDELLSEIENELGIAADDHIDAADTGDDLDDDQPGDDDTQLSSDTDTEDDAGTPAADDTEPAAGDTDDDGATDDQAEEPAAPESPAEARLAALEAKFDTVIAKLDGNATPPAAQQPAVAQAPRAFSTAEEEIAAADTPEDIARLQAKFQQIEDWAEEHADGAEIPTRDGGEPRTYTAEQVRTIGLNARRALRALPQQARHLQSRANFDEIADKAYPEFADPKSGMARYYATLRQDPYLRRLPYLKLIIGDAERGRIAREAKEKAAAGDGRPGTKVAPVARRAAPVLPSGGARKPAPVTTAQAKKAAAAKRAASVTTGSADEIAGIIEDML